MQVITHTEPGGKAINEDFVLARTHPQDHSVWICCLADGQGGTSNGAAASKMACEAFFENACAVSPRLLFKDHAVLNILNLVDGITSLSKGFTTIVGLVLDRDMAFGGSAGDSKVYVRDFADRISEVTAEQHKNPPVGSGDVVFEPFMGHTIGGSRILMVSDGVWKYAGYESIHRALDAPDPSTIPAMLRNDTIARSGTVLPDDFSLIVIQVD